MYVCHMFLQTFTRQTIQAQESQAQHLFGIIHSNFAAPAAAASTSSWNASIASLMAFNGQFSRGSTANVEK